MKNRALATILSVLILANLNACGFASEEEGASGTFEQTEARSVQQVSNATEEIKTIDRTERYHYYRVVGTFELGCDIYNSEGKIVFSERTQRPLRLSVIDDDLLEVRIGYGTGTAGCRYFSLEDDRMSEEFFSVVANYGKRIAYLSDDLDDRRLIVQDIYHPNDYYRIFDLDFSPEPMPVIDAAFSEDGAKLHVSYYMKGTEIGTAQDTLDLT